MKTHLGLSAIALSLLVLPSSVRAQDAAAGEKLFQSRCGTCHAFDATKKPGPSLAHIVGAKAVGNDPAFKYSKALASSGLTWDEATLDKYLAAPTKLVPGTSMPVSVPNPTERANIIAYLKTK
ncbi:MAG: putative cytochrome c [Rhodospirillales bacterium]|nr:putative cytochrome c [Rhodospirillales bacterium]